jgi:hypothetical protein
MYVPPTYVRTCMMHESPRLSIDRSRPPTIRRQELAADRHASIIDGGSVAVHELQSFVYIDTQAVH